MLRHAYAQNTSHHQTRGFTSGHKRPSASWEKVAQWYDGMVGDSGSNTHQAVGIQTVIRLLSIRKGDRILDLGCGQGVLAPYIHRNGAFYYGIDSSKTLIENAKNRHREHGTFFVGDATHLSTHKVVHNGPFDGCTFLLSIQDISSAHIAISQASMHLKSKGKIVIFMMHPAFRVPRQSGWGIDKQRKLVFRRVDSYLSALDVPMRTHYTTGKTLTRSFHRPIQYYINALANSSIMITRIEEIPISEQEIQGEDRAIKRAHLEIPQFLAIAGIKI